MSNFIKRTKRASEEIAYDEIHKQPVKRISNEEMVSKANGYCKAMKYEKGTHVYHVAWLAYMAGISNQ